jgi:hypothetical protein
MRDGSDAKVLRRRGQSHASHLSAGWPATLGTIMDVALIFELLIDDPKSRSAVLRRCTARSTEPCERLAMATPLCCRSREANSGDGEDYFYPPCGSPKTIVGGDSPLAARTIWRQLSQLK